MLSTDQVASCATLPVCYLSSHSHCSADCRFGRHGRRRGSIAANLSCPCLRREYYHAEQYIRRILAIVSCHHADMVTPLTDSLEVVWAL